MREITADDIESLAVGAWVLGTGGGGSPYLTLLNMRALYKEGRLVQLMPASDLDDDARTGVRGLPHRWGARWSAVAAGVLLVVTSALLVFGPGSPRPLAVAGLAVAIAVLLVGLGVQWRVPTSKAGFRAVLVAALIDVALLLTAGAVG